MKRIKCYCGSTSHIKKRNLTNDGVDILCICHNDKCSNQFTRSFNYKSEQDKVKYHIGLHKVTCSCGSNIYIRSTNKISNCYSDLYCHCKKCTNKFVISSSISEIVNNETNLDTLVKNVFNKLSHLINTNLLSAKR